MSKLNAARRNALPASDFGLPGSRKYPMPDKSHARDALARVSQQENRGAISSSSAAQVRAKAHRKLNDANGDLADAHLALHAHHQALATLHSGDAADLHRGIAEHHLRIAKVHNDLHEQHKAIADAAEEGEGSPADVAQDRAGAKAAGVSQADYENSPADRRADAARGNSTAQSGGHPVMLMGAAAQLHKAGHISASEHNRIRKAVSAKPPRRAFGSLAGAGHYMGDVDETNSPGTNAGP